MTESSQQEIQELAYFKWVEAGCPQSDGVDFWLQAEQEVLSRTSDVELVEVFDTLEVT